MIIILLIGGLFYLVMLATIVFLVFTTPGALEELLRSRRQRAPHPIGFSPRYRDGAPEVTAATEAATSRWIRRMIVSNSRGGGKQSAKAAVRKLRK